MAESQIPMSAHEFRLELSESAALDLRDILSFTLQTWGEGQLAEYKHKIDKAFKTIIEDPKVGRPKHGMMVYHVGRHLVFYRLAATKVCIIRILHERMDAAQHLT